MSNRQVVLLVLLVFYIAFIFDIALLHFPATNPLPNLVPFRSIMSDWRSGGWPFVINFVGNVVAFVPMGLLPRLINRRPMRLWQVALFGLSLSLLIEVSQYVSGRRVPDVDDLILNTFGAAVGYVLLGWPRARIRHSDVPNPAQ